VSTRPEQPIPPDRR